MERKLNGTQTDQLWCDSSHVNGLLADHAAMEELARFRSRETGSKAPLSEELLSHLNNVYATFEPVAVRLIKKRIGQFTISDPQMVEDIIAEQNSKLWVSIIDKFHWHNFSSGEYATGAFISYLDKSTGSFFAKDLIRRQKYGVDKSRKNLRSVERPVESIVIDKETPNQINTALTRWRTIAPEISVTAVERRYIDGISLEDQSVLENVGIGAIKRRLVRGKKMLFDHLEEAGVLSTDNLLSGKLLVDDQTRDTLLDDRRSSLLKVLPHWNSILAKKPKLRSALFAFYGLDGSKPLYDYSLTAEASGITLASARVLVSEGVRLLLGKIQPSDAIKTKLKDTDKFNYWRKHKDSLHISGKDAEILNLYFGEGLTHLQIAKRLKTSEETVRRKKIYALELIDLAMTGYGQ